MKEFPTIKAVRTYITQGVGSGGDYHNVLRGHWLIDNPIRCVLPLLFSSG
jgi:L-rhamnonate dehydratase